MTLRNQHVRPEDLFFFGDHIIIRTKLRHFFRLFWSSENRKSVIFELVPGQRSALGAPSNNFDKLNKLCHKCLNLKHWTPDCTKSDVCQVQECFGTFHLAVLHYSNKEYKSKPSSSQDTGSSKLKLNPTNLTSCTVVDKSVGSGVYLCVVPVTVHCGGKEFATYAFYCAGF